MCIILIACLFDTITTHAMLIQSHPRHVIAHCELINLYFFQIVKERNSLLISKRSNLNPARNAHADLRLDLSGQMMVEVDGIEPTTPCLQSRCSPS